MTRFSQFLLFLLLAMSPAAFGQTQNGGATDGSDLVAWSDMQTPQPVPQTTPRQDPVPDPNPETQPNQQQPSSQPDQAAPGQEAPSGQPQMEPAAQSFSGTIAKDGSNYVLEVSDNTSYQLDDQDTAKQHVGQKVRVLGALDTSSNMIHVQKIEPLT
jgi:hypothetical protein